MKCKKFIPIGNDLEEGMVVDGTVKEEIMRILWAVFDIWL